MKYISSWTVPQNTFNAAVARFLQTGGAPPKGVTMLGRWHGMDGRGFAISKSTDAKAMYEWVAQWADVLQLTVTPCVEDADAGRSDGVIKALNSIGAQARYLIILRRMGWGGQNGAFLEPTRIYIGVLGFTGSKSAEPGRNGRPCSG